MTRNALLVGVSLVAGLTGAASQPLYNLITEPGGCAKFVGTTSGESAELCHDASDFWLRTVMDSNVIIAPHGRVVELRGPTGGHEPMTLWAYRDYTNTLDRTRFAIDWNNSEGALHMFTTRVGANSGVPAPLYIGAEDQMAMKFSPGNRVDAVNDAVVSLPVITGKETELDHGADHILASGLSVYPTGFLKITVRGDDAPALFMLRGGAAPIELADGWGIFTTVKDAANSINVYWDAGYRIQNMRGVTRQVLWSVEGY